MLTAAIAVPESVSAVSASSAFPLPSSQCQLIDGLHSFVLVHFSLFLFFALVSEDSPTEGITGEQEKEREKESGRDDDVPD